MSKRDEFLNIKTYEEYDRRRDEFKGVLNIPADKEVTEHWNSLFPKLDNSDYRNGIIVDLRPKPSKEDQ